MELSSVPGHASNPASSVKGDTCLQLELQHRIFEGVPGIGINDRRVRRHGEVNVQVLLFWNGKAILRCDDAGVCCVFLSKGGRVINKHPWAGAYLTMAVELKPHMLTA